MRGCCQVHAYRISTTIKRTTFRDARASRHHGDLIKGPLESPRTSQHYNIEEFKVAINRDIHYAERPLTRLMNKITVVSASPTCLNIAIHVHVHLNAAYICSIYSVQEYVHTYFIACAIIWMHVCTDARRDALIIHSIHEYSFHSFEVPTLEYMQYY